MINIIMLGSREKLSLFSEYHDKMNLQSKGFPSSSNVFSPSAMIWGFYFIVFTTNDE